VYLKSRAGKYGQAHVAFVIGFGYKNRGLPGVEVSVFGDVEGVVSDAIDYAAPALDADEVVDKLGVQDGDGFGYNLVMAVADAILQMVKF